MTDNTARQLPEPMDRDEAIERLRRAIYGDRYLPDLDPADQDIADMDMFQATRDPEVGIEFWGKVPGRRSRIDRQIDRANEELSAWRIETMYLVGG